MKLGDQGSKIPGGLLLRKPVHSNPLGVAHLKWPSQSYIVLELTGYSAWSLVNPSSIFYQRVSKAEIS
jgi:hypothetical protein